MGVKLTTEGWINKARQKHGDKYDYSKVKYNGQYSKIIIICPIHGEITITPKQHLRGCGCNLCSNEKQRLTTEEFIKRANRKHGNKYDYSITKYKTNVDYVDIICRIHGLFKVIATNHLCGVGCKKCFLERQSKRMTHTTEDFIAKAKSIHSDKYDYSEVEYNGTKVKVGIICKKHGKFYITPNDHISSHNGCPKCSESKLELEIEESLKYYNINYRWQYRNKWLGLQALDFYLPDYKIGIECQGKQHFESVEHFGGDEYYSYIIKRDKSKLDKCIANNVKLYYYSNLGINYPYKVYEDKNKLIKEIINES